MKNQVWCSHVNNNCESGKWSAEDYAAPYFQRNYYVSDNVKFCPICAAPRPVEKSLEEKFRDWFVEEKSNKDFCSLASESLSKIAEEHYRGKV